MEKRNIPAVAKGRCFAIVTKLRFEAELISILPLIYSHEKFPACVAIRQG